VGTPGDLVGVRQRHHGRRSWKGEGPACSTLWMSGAWCRWGEKAAHWPPEEEQKVVCWPPGRSPMQEMLVGAPELGGWSGRRTAVVGRGRTAVVGRGRAAVTGRGSVSHRGVRRLLLI
jgi:hypothetical protein